MTGLDPVIHDLSCRGKDVDARVKPAHDDLVNYYSKITNGILRVTSVW